MKIESVEIYHVALPLVYPFRTAFSDEEAIDSILVRINSEGAAGWGESSPWRGPLYSSEWAHGAFTLVRDWLAPLLIGREVASGQELQRILRVVKGNYFAKASLRTPVCLDESIVSPDKARKALQLKACRWVNIKLGRSGGFTQALAIHDLCQEAGAPCWVGGMLESAIGQAHNIAFVTLPNIRYPSDIFPTSRFYREDLGEPPIVLSGPSQVTAALAPGIGHRPDPGRLQRFLVEHATIM